MAKRMLIDTAHSEETRVVVLNGSRLEEFDFESSTKKQIKGNIYLAKITRVEPSLQAAFVEYGGNRHGFLAFSEIHPDYYRIPVSDRDALMAQADHDDDHIDEPAPEQPDHDHEPGAHLEEADAPVEPVTASLDIPRTQVFEPIEAEPGEPAVAADAENGGNGAHEIVEIEEQPVPLETVGGTDELEETEARPRVRHYRNYKIQEVIKRRQIILVQVTKEERGNKGAALTTYLSLAGRYCVLMPNAGRGGGVSRKITSATDRRRLKDLMEDLEVPEGMGVIVRTAGSERSKAEIKRDYEYLMRLWDEIRELTLRSSAPALIYEEGNLIKRAIRDLYSRDIDDILVEGEDGYRTAKDFMRMLMPSHAARVKAYRDPTIPLFHRFAIDAQIDQIHNPVVQLRSGGYIVINPTEALVSIDVNSGRATRERNIEETATKTNSEAAEEIARQLRLRDLAGLVVIDFIDMEEGRNQRLVEAKLKDAMKSDRARIQLGRISPFGLLELSRQRLRSSLVEASTQVCPHCNGTGTIRSTESTALVVLRALEEEGIRRRSAEIAIFVPTAIALYVLNQKRDALTAIEQRYGFRVMIGQDDVLIPPAYRLERLRSFTPDELAALPAPTALPVFEEPEEPEPEIEAEEAIESPGAPAPKPVAEDDADKPRRKRRRRRRRRGPDDRGPESTADANTEDGGEEDDGDEAPGGDEGGEPVAASPATTADSADAAGEARRRRRGRRGGRRRPPAEGGPEETIVSVETDQPSDEDFELYPSVLDFARDGRPTVTRALAEPEPEPAPETPTEPVPIVVEIVEEPPVKPRRSRRKPAAETAEVEAATEVPTEEAPPAKPRRTRRKPAEAVTDAAPAEAVDIVAVETVAPEPEPAVVEPAPVVVPATVEAPVPTPEPESPAPEPVEDLNRPRRSGWWKRLIS
jgi:ribonuclease E